METARSWFWLGQEFLESNPKEVQAEEGGLVQMEEGGLIQRREVGFAHHLHSRLLEWEGRSGE